MPDIVTREWANQDMVFQVAGAERAESRISPIPGKPGVAGVSISYARLSVRKGSRLCENSLRVESSSRFGQSENQKFW
jgi:hypothetical protein